MTRYSDCIALAIAKYSCSCVTSTQAHWSFEDAIVFHLPRARTNFGSPTGLQLEGKSSGGSTV